MRRSLRLVMFLSLLAATPLMAADPGVPEAALKALETYDWAGDHTAIAPVRAAVSAAGKDAAIRAALEPKLAAAVKNAKTQAARRWACEWLSLIATDASIDTLTAMLATDDSAHFATLALVRINSPKSAAALRAGVSTTKGNIQLGVIGGLGQMRDAEAVAVLAPLLKSADESLVRTALLALGRIGTPEAAVALLDWSRNAPERLKRDASVACLTAADALVADKKLDAAAKVYAALQSPAQPEYIRAAAVRGLMLAVPAEARKQLDAALAGSDAKRREYMLRLAADLPGSEITTVVAAALPKLSSAEKILALASLARRNDAAARPAVIAAAKSKDLAVRAAALQTLGAVGEPADVPLLLAAAQEKDESISTAAHAALQSLKGAQVDATLAASLAGTEAVRIEALRALGSRNTTAAAPAIATELASSSEPVRIAAAEALRTAGTAKEIPAVLAAIKSAKSDAQREALDGTLPRLAPLAGAAGADVFLAALRDPAATTPTRVSILRVLPLTPSADALNAVAAATGDASTDIADEAARALSRWPDPAAIDPLRKLAKSAKLTHQVLALRGIAALVEKTDNTKLAPAAKYSVLAEVWPLATRIEEKRLMLNAFAAAPTKESLDRVVKALSDKDLSAEACGGAIRLGQKLYRTEPKLVQDAMKQVLAVTKNKTLKGAAERLMAGDDAEPGEGDEIIN